ncbi:hypothetical protein [Halocatena pleomorpha]|uniref:DUF8055 domain-containing protein n=1 Tax=Halocatena pleomorpha TaxID=1785090 RepID=A0A3P3R9Q5_9EURY|nr:hypothetical protein [Halocatena pleomorpha]RRJ29203.1 hypothetical protein EIK79_13790 [Halocatena pleomorpha]
MNTERHERIATLTEQARQDRAAFEPPADPPDEERAVGLLRNGVGPAVSVYIEAHATDEPARFDPGELSRLERAMNDWLTLYARCYDVSIDAEFTVREAAELLLETHDIKDTAQLLTQVPPRARNNTGTNG